jgi:signal peptidase II
MRGKNTFYYLLISLIIIIADQITKALILRYLVENESVSILGDLLYFRFIFNEGGAMGTSLGPSWVYTILTVLALILIVRYFSGSKSDGVFSKVSLALILGGAIGNLIDRLRYGKVVDFIDMDMPDIPFLHLYRWFTFNIADAAITVGLLLFALSIFMRKKIEDNLPNLPEAGAPEVESDSPKG